MIPSVTYLAVFDQLRSQQAKLKADDPRFNRYVSVVHQDGTVYAPMNAFIALNNDTWLGVLAEHQDVQLYRKSDLFRYSEGRIHLAGKPNEES